MSGRGAGEEKVQKFAARWLLTIKVYILY